MTEFSDFQHLHLLLDDAEEDHEEDEALDLSLQLALNGYDAKNLPSEGGEHQSPFSGGNLPGSLGKSLTLDRSIVQNSTGEPSSARRLLQVDLNLGLSDNSPSTQFDTMTDSSVRSLSNVDSGFCEGQYDLGSYHLGLVLGSDHGDGGCFWSHNYGERYVDHVGGDPDSLEISCGNGVGVVEEELGVGRPVGLAQNSLSSSLMAEFGDSSMTLGAQSGSLGASASISGIEGVDLIDIDGNSCRNDDSSKGIECFGVVGMETDSDEEEFLDPQADGSPIVGRISNLGVDNRSESDVLAHDADYQLWWGCLRFCYQSDSAEDYEWEEVDGGMDISMGSSQSNSVYGGSTSDDILVHTDLPEVLDLHESSGIEVTDTEANVGDRNDMLETTENLDWSILDHVYYWGTRNYDVEASGVVPAEVFEVLVGQFTNNDSLLRGSQPASKCFVARLPSVSLMKENSDSSRSVCAICKDEVSREELVKQLPCSHCYHSSCILPWLSIRSTCPLCRYQLPTDDPDYEQRRMQNPR